MDARNLTASDVLGQHLLDWFDSFDGADGDEADGEAVLEQYKQDMLNRENSDAMGYMTQFTIRRAEGDEKKF